MPALAGVTPGSVAPSVPTLPPDSLLPAAALACPSPATDPVPDATGRRGHRRAAWPTLTCTLLALLAVLAVLLLSGGGSATVARFGLRADPSAISLTAGDSAPVVLILTAEPGFHGTVALSTTALPPGVQLELDRRSVSLSADQPAASVSGQLRTSDGAATSAVGIEVVGRSGRISDTSLIELQVQPAGVADPASPPPVVSGVSRFTVSGTARGTLRPGGSLPIDLRLVNANPFGLSIDSLKVAVAGTSKPACQPANFVIVPYRGGYPLRIPAGSTSTLASLRVPSSRWPQLRMRTQAPASCLGASVQLRYAGSGSVS